MIVSKDKEGIYSLQYSELIPVLVKAIQEQQAQIEVLKSENTDLKSENDTQKVELEKHQKEIVEINAQLALIQQLLNGGQSMK